MGVGHVCPVPGGVWCDWEPTGDGERWAACGQRERGVLYRLCFGERWPESQRCDDWISERDSARLGHGACDVQWIRQGVAHFLREDDVGIGHVDSVQGRFWGDV